MRVGGVVLRQDRDIDGRIRHDGRLSVEVAPEFVGDRQHRLGLDCLNRADLPKDIGRDPLYNRKIRAVAVRNKAGLHERRDRRAVGVVADLVLLEKAGAVVEGERLAERVLVLPAGARHGAVVPCVLDRVVLHVAVALAGALRRSIEPPDLVVEMVRPCPGLIVLARVEVEEELVPHRARDDAHGLAVERVEIVVRNPVDDALVLRRAALAQQFRADADFVESEHERRADVRHDPEIDVRP